MIRRLTVATTPDAPPDPSLARGLAGIALLRAYEALRRGGDPSRDLDRVLETALDAALRPPTSEDPGLFSGIVGVGWAAAHVGRLFPQVECDLDGLDQAVLDIAGTSPWAGYYDLVSGLVGMGVYALERLPCPAARDTLEAVVARLTELADTTAEGSTWWTAPEQVPEHRARRYPDGCVDLGVAHGVAGVIGLLAGACHAGVAADRAGPLMSDAMRWLLAHAAPTPRGTYPSFWAPDVVADPAGRPAWCYGDLGIAAVLLNAGAVMGEQGWVDHAVELAVAAAATLPDDPALTTPGLCHGAAGVGHIFTLLGRATGDGRLNDAATLWLQRAARTRSSAPDGGWLEGTAGIDLAVLTAATTADHGWDRALLLSLPAAPGDG